VGLVLVHACQQELAAMGSSIEEDLAAGGGGKKDKADAAAVAFRVEKKRVLEACLKELTGS
jgi:hypothetical protein